MNLRSIFRLIFDQDSARKTEQEVQGSIRRGTDPSAAEQNIGRVRKALEGLRAVAVKLAGALGIAFSVRAIMRFGQEARLLHESLASSIGTLEQQLLNVGVVYNEVADEINAASKDLWRSHILGSEEFIVTLTELVKTTGDYEQSLKHVGLAANLAAATGTSLEKAAQRIGRVLQGDIAWMARYGWAVEDAADALRFLEERLDGAAASAPTVSQELAKTWARFKELVGAFLYEMGRVDGAIAKLNSTVQWMIDNFDDLADAVRGLVQAIMVAGAVLALNRLRTAIIAANVATTTFLGTLRSFYLLVGPKGWLILGVTTLAEVFRRAGKAAREAAEDAKEADKQFKELVKTATLAEIEQEIIRIDKRRREIEEEIARKEKLARQLANQGQLGIGSLRTQMEIVELRQEDNRLLAQSEELAARRNELAEGEAAATKESTAATKLDVEAVTKRVGLLHQGHRLSVLTNEERLEAIDLEDRIQQAIARGNLTLEDRISLQEALIRLAEMQPDDDIEISPVGLSIERPRRALELKPIEQKEEYSPEDLRRAQAITDAILGLAPIAINAAHGVSNAWADAFRTIMDEGEQTMTFMEALGRGIGAAMLGGLAEFASTKVAQNMAAAVEAFAVALGMKALGNFASASAAAKAGAGHLAAAAAWSALGGASAAAQGKLSGGTALSGGLPSGATDIGSRIARDTDRQRPEVHIYIDPLDPSNPAWQRAVYAASRYATDRYGEGAHVTIHPRTGGR